MPGQADDLSHEDLAFRFMAGRVSLALTATVGERWRRSFERLRAPADLAGWLTAAGLISGPVSASDEHLQLACELREAIYRCARAIITEQRLGKKDVACINRVAIAPTPAPQLDLRRRAFACAEDPVQGALSVVARDAVDLFSGPWATRIRECASDQCGLLFVDLSRPGRRRWCSSDTCGTRARSAAYRSRSQH